jgi:UDP-sugar transporter A1/2/3
MVSGNVLKWGALSIFVLQNAGVILLMKLSRNSPGVPYSTRVAVLAQEVVKLLICSALYAYETGGLMAAVLAVRADVRDNAIEWLQLGIPAGLYTLQNNALFIGLSNLDAAVAHVTYQTKILFTAVFSITLLGKRLGTTQWSGLTCLVIGVICVQGLLDKLLQAYSDHGRSSAGTAAPTLAPRHPASRPHAAGRGLQPAPLSLEAAAASRTWLLGIAAMLCAALCTSFASVYFERMLKGDRKPSLWLRNIQARKKKQPRASPAQRLSATPARAQGGC